LSQTETVWLFLLVADNFRLLHSFAVPVLSICLRHCIKFECPWIPLYFF